MSPQPSRFGTVSHPAQRGRALLVERYHWLTFVLPFAVFMLVGTIEPKPPAEGANGWLAIPYQYYPVIYSIKIALTLAAMWFVLPGYRKFPFRITLLGILVGVMGIFIWVGLVQLQWEHRLLPGFVRQWLTDLGTRSGYNPFQELRAMPVVWAWGFLAVRLFGLVVVVPVIEEFFLRGFLMRFVMDRDWWKIPFGQASASAVVVGTVFPMLMHPAELFAAAVWFSLVTWLMVRTRSIWDCVVAHAVTNLLLGIYVVAGGHWRLL